MSWRQVSVEIPSLITKAAGGTPTILAWLEHSISNLIDADNQYIENLVLCR